MKLLQLTQNLRTRKSLMSQNDASWLRQNNSSVYLNIWIFWKRSGRQKILHRMIAFPDFNLLLISSWILFWFVKSVPKYLNSSTLSKELFSIFISCLRPSFRCRGMTMYLVLLAFASSPFSLPAATEASAFFFIVRTLPPNILTHTHTHTHTHQNETSNTRL